MKSFVELVIAISVLGLLLFNGVLMLISPTRWFALPSYIAFHGSMRLTLLSMVWGNVLVRVIGLGFAAFAVLALFAFVGGK